MGKTNTMISNALQFGSCLNTKKLERNCYSNNVVTCYFWSVVNSPRDNQIIKNIIN